MMALWQMAKAIIPIRIRRQIKLNFLDGYAQKSYSQEGEDIILSCMFRNKHVGFYVDVGAYHPKRFSNTFLFYKRGWRGINIDAMPAVRKTFIKARPRDINLEIAVSDKKERLTYHIFDETALNGFIVSLADRRGAKNAKNRIVRTVDMESDTLGNILDGYVPPGQWIDFLTVDVEGMEYEVLRSNNWEKYRPYVVLVEMLGKTIEEILKHEITSLLGAYNYQVFAKTINTVIYKRPVL
jgi:FkbM family methyltransferase